MINNKIKYLYILSTFTLNNNIYAQDEILKLNTIEVIERPTYNTENSDSYTIEAMNSSTKFNLSIKDTPQTINVITTKEMKDKHIGSYKDVLSNIAGVTLNNRGTNIVSSSRGFENLFYKIDGFPLYSDYSSNNFDMSLYDRVEVVKGANGIVTGEGNPSLSANFIRKHANSKELTGNIILDAGSWDSFAQTIDITSPLNTEKNIRARILFKHSDAKSFYDKYERERNIFYTIIDSDLSDNTSFSIGANYQESNTIAPKNWGIPVFYKDGSNTNFSRSHSLSPKWSYWDIKTKEVFSSFKHYFNNESSLNMTTSYKELEQKIKTVKIFFGSALDKDGSGGKIQQYQGETSSDEFNFDTYVNFPFEISNLSQEIITGFSYNVNKARETKYKTGFDFPKDLFDYDNEDLLTSKKYSTYKPEQKKQISTYLTTNLSLCKDLKFILGVRATTWKYQTDESNIDERVFKNVLTPYAGLVYNINNNHSLFLSYTDIFKTQNRKDVNDQYLDPIVGKNYEAGIKSEYFGGKLNGSFSVFRLVEDNLAQAVDGVTRSNGDTAFEAIEGVTSEGFELSLNGKISENIGTTFSIANFSMKDEEENINTKNARTTANLFFNFKVSKYAELGAGLKYTSKYYDGEKGDEHFIEQDAYILANLMGKYYINNETSIQLNINNLFDKKYYEGMDSNGNWIVYGDPRNFNLSLNYSF